MSRLYCFIVGIIVLSILNGCSLLSMYPESDNIDYALMPRQGANGKYGYENREGRFVIPPQFDDEVYFGRGNCVAKVIYKGRIVYLNKKGEFSENK